MHAFSVIIVYLYIIGGGNPLCPSIKTSKKDKKLFLSEHLFL